jgi:intracellular septation protein
MQRTTFSWIKPFVDYGPLVAFFVAYLVDGLFVATAALMIVTAVAVPLAVILERRIPVTPIVTAVIVLIFGGLTLWFDDERFIKMKPTIVQTLFAAVLFGGLFFRRPLLKPLLQSAWQLTERGWSLLTLRFALFFTAMAALNEVVWRTASTDFWVNFKVFGILVLTFLFTALQVPLITKYQLPDGRKDSSTGG